MKTSPSIGAYLIQRLYAHGVRHVFGIPGNYVLGLYELYMSKLCPVNTCDGKALTSPPTPRPRVHSQVAARDGKFLGQGGRGKFLQREPSHS